MRVRDLRRRSAQLKAQVKERTRQLEDANRTLERLASTDPLTGLTNRRRFQVALGREWRRSVRSSSPISIVVLDIDRFKAYNDTYGHQQGDHCLRGVAEALRDVVRRAGDLVSRYGGEEFAALLPDVDRRHALAMAERFRSAVERLELEHEASDITSHVTISAGVATLVPSNESSPDALVHLADEALYRAKSSGRNQVSD